MQRSREAGGMKGPIEPKLPGEIPYVSPAHETARHKARRVNDRKNMENFIIKKVNPDTICNKVVKGTCQRSSRDEISIGMKSKLPL